MPNNCQSDNKTDIEFDVCLADFDYIYSYGDNKHYQATLITGCGTQTQQHYQQQWQRRRRIM